MNFEDKVMAEVAAAILSIEGPYIDLSAAGRLREQTRPIEQYYDIPDEDMPLAVIYIDGEAYNQVANDRYEISLRFRISLVYRKGDGESKPAALMRGKRCLRQIYRKITERQSSGEAAAMLYSYTGVEDIRAVNHDANPDGDDMVCIVSGQINLNQLEMED